jgi:superkiller protein 3
MALASIDLGELEMAEAHYRESLAIKQQPEIYNDLGFVLEREGLTDEAGEMYRKAVKLDPESASAQYNLGSWLARSGKYAEAESHLRKAVTKDPNTRNYTGLGIVLWQQGRAGEAITSLQAAIEADPKNAAAHQKLAEVLDSQGRADEARRESELAKTLDQGPAVAQ